MRRMYSENQIKNLAGGLYLHDILLSSYGRILVFSNKSEKYASFLEIAKDKKVVSVCILSNDFRAPITIETSEEMLYYRIDSQHEYGIDYTDFDLSKVEYNITKL